MKAAVRRILLSAGLSSSGNLGGGSERLVTILMLGWGSEEGRGPLAKMECQCSLVAMKALRPHDSSVSDNSC